MASINFIDECKNKANGNRLGKILVDNYEITNSDNLQNFSIDSGCYVDGNIIGSVYVKCLNGQFIAIPENVDLINKNITTKIGVKYADLSNEYINMGKYTIERPKDEVTANMSQITAYDSLYTNLDSKYICNIDYSTGNKTVSDLYIDVCNQLELTPTTTTFINSTIPIINNPFTNGEKNRTVLQMVAKIASSFIDIDNDTNKIDLCWLSQSEEPDYIFYKNDYVSAEGGKIVCGPVNCLIIKNSQIDDENVSIKDEESIALHGEHSITISEDYVLHNVELREQAINSIWNRVRGVTYVDCKLTTYYGKPFLKLGDKIRIYTSKTDYFDTYVLKHQFTYDGTFTSIIESPVLTEQEIKTKQDIGLQEKLKNTQIDVNKQEQKITSIISDVSQYDEKIASVEQTVDGLNQKIENTIDLIRKQDSYNKIFLENVMKGPLLKLSISGNLRYIFPSNTLYPSPNLFSKSSILVVDQTERLSEKAKFYKLPMKNLYYYDQNTYDELIIENSKVFIIRRCELNDNLDVVKLSSPVMETYEDINIELFDDNNYIYMYSFQNDNLKYQVTYTIKSKLADTFATKVEMNSTIKQARDEIDLSVTKQITDATDTDTLISRINLKPGQILLEGTVTANNNFKILTDGSIDATNGSFSGNIYLENGNRVVGGDGLLSNLQFVSSGQFHNYDYSGIFGYDDNYGNPKRIYGDVCVEVDIPEDFTITEAYLTYYHIPVYWHYYRYDPNTGAETQQEFWGSSKNMKVFNAGDSGYDFNMSLTGYSIFPANIYSSQEVLNAFGEESYSPQNTMFSSVESKKTLNIKDSIKTGHNVLVVRTANNKENYITVDCLKQCGMGRAVVNIIGYKSFKEEVF